MTVLSNRSNEATRAAARAAVPRPYYRFSTTDPLRPERWGEKREEMARMPQNARDALEICPTSNIYSLVGDPMHGGRFTPTRWPWVAGIVS